MVSQLPLCENWLLCQFLQFEQVAITGRPQLVSSSAVIIAISFIFIKIRYPPAVRLFLSLISTGSMELLQTLQLGDAL